MRNIIVIVLLLISAASAHGHNPNLIMLTIQADGGGFRLLYHDQTENNANAVLDSAAHAFIRELIVEIDGERQLSLNPTESNGHIVLLSRKHTPQSGVLRIQKPAGRRIVCVSLNDQRFQAFRAAGNYQIAWSYHHGALAFESQQAARSTSWLHYRGAIAAAAFLVFVLIAKHAKQKSNYKPVHTT